MSNITVSTSQPFKIFKASVDDFLAEANPAQPVYLMLYAKMSGGQRKIFEQYLTLTAFTGDGNVLDYTCIVGECWAIFDEDVKTIRARGLQLRDLLKTRLADRDLRDGIIARDPVLGETPRMEKA